MSSYNVFAKYYDFLTQNIDYDAGSSFISGIFKDNNIKSVLDLACGTGIISEKLIDCGFDIIGIDMSSDMLTEAEIRLNSYKGRYSLINAKMQDFKLTESVDGVICCLDSINHLTDEKDVLKTFNNVFDSLNIGGIFIFDVNSVYKHQTALNNKAYVFDEEDFFLSWDNELLDDNIVRIMLDFFVFNGESYDRYSEEFFERAYSEASLSNMLKNAGFSEVRIYGETDFSEPNDESERLYFVCKK
jgi:ubiquinone/menaquinone biosynthesis C-methylase UbiE